MTQAQAALAEVKIATEDKLRAQLSSHVFVRGRIDVGLITPSYLQALLRRQWKDAVELTGPLQYHCQGALELATKRLGFDWRNIDLFEAPSDPHENASIGLCEGRIRICFEPGLLAQVADEVIVAMIGHALGHFVYGHTVDRLLRAIRLHHSAMLESLVIQPSRRSPEQRELIAAWDSPEAAEMQDFAGALSRLEEMNADRAALIASQKVEAAITAGLLLSGGRASQFGKYNPQHFLELGRTRLRRRSCDENEFSSRHPHPATRALALEFFSRTRVYHQLSSRGPGELLNEDFEHLLPHLCPGRFSFLADLETSKVPAYLLEPIPGQLNLKQPNAAELKPVSTWSEFSCCEAVTEAEPLNDKEYALLKRALVLEVLYSDGHLTPAEERLLAGLIRPIALSSELVDEYQTMDAAALEAREAKLLERARGLNSERKAALIRSMIRAAKADRVIAKEELLLISRISAQFDATQLAEYELRDAFGDMTSELLAGRGQELAAV